MIQVWFLRRCAICVDRSATKRISCAATCAARASIPTVFPVPRTLYLSSRSTGCATTAFSARNATAASSGRTYWSATFARRSTTSGASSHSLSRYLSAVGNARTASSAELVVPKSFSANGTSQTRWTWTRTKSTYSLTTLNFATNVARTSSANHSAIFAMRKQA